MSSNFLKRNNHSDPTLKNNRLYLLVAIIFLIFITIIIKLYYLQILQHEKYLAKADNQHNTYKELKARRGTIYLKSKDGELYPVALNKDFASIYINPRALSEDEIKNVLEHVYNVFHKNQVEEEVDKYLAEQEEYSIEEELKYIDNLNISDEEKKIKKEEVVSRQDNLSYNSEWLEFQKMKRELEINDRKQNIINDYFCKVNVVDKYSRLVRRKIEKEDLINFYFDFLKDELFLSTSSDLSLSNGTILFKEENISNKIKGLNFTWETLRYYPEKNFFSNVVGFSNLENVGSYGLEASFNKELKGEDGYLLGDKGSYKGEKIIIDKDEYLSAVNGQNLVLTIDYAVQVHVCKKLEEAQAKHNFTGGSIIVMNPKTGAIVAMCSWPDFDPNNYQDVDDIKVFDNQVVAYQYEPGSIFKTITMAAAIDQGKVTPDTHYDDKGQIKISGWSKMIKNSDYDTHGGHGWVDMNYVLENSLNTGAIFAVNQIGEVVFADYLKKFGFGEKTGIDLISESSGDINTLLSDKVKDINLATASFGQGLAVTPIQMIMAYGAIANKGILMKPYIVSQILDKDNNVIEETKSQKIRQVISENTAQTISAMLVNVVENGHAKRSKVAGYYIGGKTGTAQIPSGRGGYLDNKYIHTFVGYGPIEDPQFVMLVKFDSPNTSVYAEGTVVPVFGEIIDFLLKYYQIVATRKI